MLEDQAVVEHQVKVVLQETLEHIVHQKEIMVEMVSQVDHTRVAVEVVLVLLDQVLVLETVVTAQHHQSLEFQ